MDVTTVLLAIGCAMLSLVPIAWVIADRRQPAPPLHRRIEAATLLFRDGRLIDATAPGRAFLARSGAEDLDGFLGWLSGRIPEARSAVARAGADGRAQAGKPGGLALTAEDLGAGHLRLSISDPAASDAGILVDSLSLAALEEEVDSLRLMSDSAPVLAWRQTPEGEISWANAGYVALCAERAEDGGLWPLPHLFPVVADTPDSDEAQSPQRQALDRAEGQQWFDCHMRRAEDGDVMVFAVPADTTVKAERNLREFVQTLTKTFAGLPIGLAIFDRDRKLQLFNPALIDLTNLPIGFLSARPSLFDLLDRLREARMVPEPRDYRSWRKQMSTLEAESAAGQHVETWSLPGGQTYRVTGRPHADGGIAFLLEDITSEITLRRRFRSDLAVQRQVLDALDDALGVFAPDGALELANTAWVNLWGEAPGTLAECLAAWASTAARAGEAEAGPPGAGFTRLADTLGPAQDRTPATGAVIGPEGAPLGWRVSPLPGGRRLVGFSQHPLASLAIPEGLAALEAPRPESAVS